MTECPRGYYCPTKKTPAPVACPAGYYCPDVRTITFTNNTCPAGYYCPTASINATICPAGYYCPSLAANRTACSPGTYSPVDASTSCTNCSVDKTSKVAAKECVYYPSVRVDLCALASPKQAIFLDLCVCIPLIANANSNAIHRPESFSIARADSYPERALFSAISGAHLAHLATFSCTDRVADPYP